MCMYHMLTCIMFTMVIAVAKHLRISISALKRKSAVVCKPSNTNVIHTLSPLIVICL